MIVAVQEEFTPTEDDVRDAESLADEFTTCFVLISGLFERARANQTEQAVEDLETCALDFGRAAKLMLMAAGYENDHAVTKMHLAFAQEASAFENLSQEGYEIGIFNCGVAHKNAEAMVA